MKVRKCVSKVTLKIDIKLYNKNMRNEQALLHLKTNVTVEVFNITF